MQEPQETQVQFLGQEDSLEKEMAPTAPVFLPGKSHGQRSLASYSLWGCKELDMTERLSTLSNEEKHQRCPGVQWQLENEMWTVSHECETNLGDDAHFLQYTNPSVTIELQKRDFPIFIYFMCMYFFCCKECNLVIAHFIDHQKIFNRKLIFKSR